MAALGKAVAGKVKLECPDVEWVSNYAVLGPCDYLDIFEAPGLDEATKVALIVRSVGHSTTETWSVTPWEQYVSQAGALED